MKLAEVTLICPYYRNQAMLAVQVHAWNRFPKGVRVIVVDDGAPEPAEPIIRQAASPELLDRLELYRVGVNIAWNRGGARNLGTRQAATDWIIHIDIDHLLPPECAVALLRAEVKPDRWYRFRRFRNGQADETRNKDAIPRSQSFGEIKPHIDSYLCTRESYWQAGGYNEDFSGCLGGGSPFLQELEKVAPVALLPDDVSLHVYTRDRCPDASDLSLSRETGEFARRKKLMGGNYRGHDPVRFPWARVL